MNEKAADSVNSNTEENYQTWESLSKVVKFESEKQKGFLWQICFKITQNEPISSVVICPFPCDRDLLTTCLHNVKLRSFEKRMSFWSIFFWVIGVAFVILRKTQHFLFTESKYTAGKKRKSRRRINIQVKPDRLVEQWKRKEARKYNDPDWLLGSRLIWSIVWYFELQMIIWLERL